MKKIILFSILITIISCTNKKLPDFVSNHDYKELLKQRTTIEDPVEKFYFYQHLLKVHYLDELKKEKELNGISDNDLIQIIDSSMTIYSIYEINFDKLKLEFNRDSLTRKDILNTNQILDSVANNDIKNLPYLTEELNLGSDSRMFFHVTSENILAIEYELGSTASCSGFYYLIENKKVKYLNDIYSYLKVNEYKLLEKTIKSKLPNYIHPSDRMFPEIKKEKNGNYAVRFLALESDDANCCPSAEVRFETSDFETIVPNSVTIKLLLDTEIMAD